MNKTRRDDFEKLVDSAMNPHGNAHISDVMRAYDLAIDDARKGEIRRFKSALNKHIQGMDDIENCGHDNGETFRDGYLTALAHLQHDTVGDIIQSAIPPDNVFCERCENYHESPTCAFTKDTP